MTLMILALIAVTVLIVILWKRDPRLPQIAVLLAVILALIFLLTLGERPGRDFDVHSTAKWFVSVFVGIPIILFATSIVFLLLRQGRGTNESDKTGNRLLPLLASTGILASYGCTTLYFASRWTELDLLSVGLGLLGVVAIVGAYLLLMTYGYVLHALLYAMSPKPVDPDFIIVNGEPLWDGEITPLLKSRLDRAFEVYNCGGGRATILPSGGWASGDVRSESDAMVEYLLGKMVPADQIVPEDQSTTTQESLEHSHNIIEMRSSSDSLDVLFVTSSYHLYRTALIARSLGIRASGVGTSVPLHLLPGSILREITALFWMHKLWHSIPILVVTGYYQVFVLPTKRYDY